MNYNKGIWKSGVLAVAVTVVFAIFIFRAADWTKGLNSEFVVYGQTGGGGGSIGGTGTSGGTLVTKVLPQIAVGSFGPDVPGSDLQYNTVIQITNTNSTPVVVSGNFYTQGGTASPVALTATGGVNISGGVLPSTTISGNTVFVVTGDPASARCTTEYSRCIAWGKIVSNGSVTV